MGTGTCVKYISFGSFVLYEECNLRSDDKTKKKKTSLQNGFFKQRKHSEPLENHRFFKKGTQFEKAMTTKISIRV